MADTSDRNLLFGILAVQLEFINSDQLVETANTWMLDKAKSLGDILVDRGVLPVDDRRFLEQIVDKHIAKTGSPKESLERLQDFGSSIQTGAFVERFRSAELPTDEVKLHSTHVSSPVAPDGHEQTLPLRYKFLKDLARGGLGRVSVARDVELERDVALKEILNDKAGSAEARDRFVLEAKITGSLEHPGIVPVYGLGSREDGSPYYAMRLIRGKSLHKEIKSLFETERGKKTFASVDQQTVRRLLRGIVDACNAVAYAHSRGVLHRDLKPSNIMLGKYGETLVVDWGLAKVLGDPNDTLLQSEPAVVDARLSDSSLTMMGSVLGSPGYMSPEQAQGRLDLLDVRSDVFCLGACLYFLLTNQAPFQGNSRESTLEAARSNQFKPPREVDSTVPKALEAVCLRAMAKESAARYETASDLADDIDRWIAGEPVAAMVEPVWQRAGRWARRNQTLVASTIVLLVASFVALAISNRIISGERDVARQERDRANELKTIADNATADARHERDTAEKLREKADAATLVARRNSDALADVLKQFVKTLGDDKWARFPGFEAERVAMVELAVDRLETIYEKSPDDSLRKELIYLSNRLSLLYRITGEHAKSNARMERSLQLVKKYSSYEPQYFAIIGDTLAEYINAMTPQLSSMAIEPTVLMALDLNRRRLKARPNSIPTKVALLQALLQTMEVKVHLQAYNEARSLGREALGLIESDLKQSEQYAHVVSIFHFYSFHLIGKTFLKEGNLLEAEKNLIESLNLANKALDQYPNESNVIQYRQDVILDHAELEFQKGNFDEGFGLLDESRKVYESLVDQWTDTKQYSVLLFGVQLSIAERAILSGRSELAQRSFLEAKELLTKFPEPETISSKYLPQHLRLNAIALRLATPENATAAREQYELSRARLASFEPSSPALSEVEKILRQDETQRK